MGEDLCASRGVTLAGLGHVLTDEGFCLVMTVPFGCANADTPALHDCIDPSGTTNRA
jgi:hypothetical protein